MKRLKIYGSLIVICLLWVFSGCQVEECRDCTQCYSISKKKNWLDSVFTPIRCLGLITDVEYQTFYDHGGHYTFLTIVPDSDFGFVGRRQKIREIDFVKSNEVRIGLRRRHDDRISVGDTFMKIDGEYYFSILKIGGDTILAELKITNRVRGNDWRYIRKNGQICHEVW